MAIGRTNCFSSAPAEEAPAILGAFTFDGGTYQMTHEGKRVELLTNGTFIPSEGMSVDIFLVAGGQGGGNGASSSGAGGKGGETKTVSNVFLEAGKEYAVTIGAGGSSGASKGGDTFFATHTVTGGYQNYTESTAFGEESEMLYGVDGGTGYQNGPDLEPNTGHGGTGGFGNGAAKYKGQKGSSGIVILRVHEEVTT